MVEVNCRYFRKGFTDSVTEDEGIAVIGSCIHPKFKSDSPDCEVCVVYKHHLQQLCPGVTQKMNPDTHELRYRCNILKVKLFAPLTECKSLRTCPRDSDES